MRRLGRFSLLLLVVTACAHAVAPNPERYRLAESGDHWDRAGDDPVLEDLRPRYPDFFEHALDPSRSDELNLLQIREDLEKAPTDRRNYDALNAVAIAYFEANYQAEASRGEGMAYMSRSFQAAKLLAVPWKAYGLTEDSALREGILDFFEDAGTSDKLGSASTAARLIRIVASLERKESDPARTSRIRALVSELEARQPEPEP